MMVRAIGCAVVLLLVGGRAASAQIIVPRESLRVAQKARQPVVLASVSFTPYALAGKLGEAWIVATLQGVTITAQATRDGTVMLEQARNPEVDVRDAQGLPNGAYSVQFRFSQASSPTVVKILAGPANTTVAQCALAQSSYTANEPAKICDSGILQVVDQKLALSLLMVQGYQLHLASITVNALQSLGVR
jgi:hypothetical protein